MKKRTLNLSNGNWIVVEYTNPTDYKIKKVLQDKYGGIELGETCLCINIKETSITDIENILVNQYKCERSSITSINDKTITAYPDFEEKELIKEIFR